MKAIEAGSLERCFVQMDIGSKDRLAPHNLQIPDKDQQTEASLTGFSLAASLLSKDSLPVVQTLY